MENERQGWCEKRMTFALSSILQKKEIEKTCQEANSRCETIVSLIVLQVCFPCLDGDAGVCDMNWKLPCPEGWIRVF